MKRVIYVWCGNCFFYWFWAWFWFLIFVGFLIGFLFGFLLIVGGLLMCSYVDIVGDAGLFAGVGMFLFVFWFV